MQYSEDAFLAKLTEATEGAFAPGSPSTRLERLFGPFLNDGSLRKVSVTLDKKTLVDLTAATDSRIDHSVNWKKDFNVFPEHSLEIACEVAEDFPESRRALVCKLFIGVVRLALTDAELQGLRNTSDETTERVAALYDISEPNDTIELPKLLEIITKRASEVMGAQACSMMRPDPETRILRIEASHGLDDTVRIEAQQAWGEGIAGQVAMTGESRLLIDQNTDGTREEWRRSIGSSMIVPMKNKAGNVMGVLSIRRRRPSRDFTNDDLRLFTLLARQAAMVIDNKEQYDDLQWYVRQMKSLSEYSLAISAQKDINLLFQQVADIIVNVVEFDRCAIFLKDEKTRHYKPKIIRGYGDIRLNTNQLRIGTRVSKQVVVELKSILATDLEDQPELIVEFAHAIDVDSFVAIPIIVQNEAIGAVVADNQTSRRSIRRRSIDLLLTFVARTGIACQIAKLNNDVRQQMEEHERIAQHVSSVLGSLGEAVLVVNEKMIVTDVNQPATNLFGVRSPMTGLPFTDIINGSDFSPGTSAQIVSAIQTCAATGRPNQVYRIGLKQGRPDERLFNVLINPLRPKAKGPLGTVILLEDVTEATQKELEANRLRRLADIGQMTAIVAHEVRNPLGAIRAGAQVMAGESDISSTASEMADIIIAEVDHLTKITTDMLEFAGPMVSHFQFVDLNQVVARTVALLRPAFDQAHVSLSAIYPEQSVTIEGDPKLLEKMLRNLMINSLQATPAGGSTTVQTSFDASNDMRVLTVTDTGEGIDQDRKKYIFQPFITTRVKGTGLGLSLVRRIVEDHFGRIEVDSKPCVGTTFTIYLPTDPNKEGAKGLAARGRQRIATVPDSTAIHSGVPPYGM